MRLVKVDRKGNTPAESCVRLRVCFIGQEPWVQILLFSCLRAIRTPACVAAKLRAFFLSSEGYNATISVLHTNQPTDILN